jgi:biopolymer transport protein ExbB/TolQ
MSNDSNPSQRYILATVLCAIAGGLVVAIATKAIPRMMSRMMSGMMKNMMSQMREGSSPYSEI